MKVCNRCNIEKDLSLFPFRKDRGVYHTTCKECKAKSLREFRDTNREEYNAKCTAWRNATIERQREIRRDWKRANPEKVNERKRKDWESNKEELNERRREKRQYNHFMTQLEQSFE